MRSKGERSVAAWSVIVGAVALAAIGCAAKSNVGGPAGVGGGAGSGAVSGSGGVGGSGAVSGVGGSSGVGGVSGVGATGGNAGVGGIGGVGGDREPISIDETGSGNPANATPEQVTQLMTGGGGGARLLYPYADTVFPRGILPPEVMWEGGAATAIYLHVRSQLFEYKGVLPPGQNPAGITLPQHVWDAMGNQTLGKSDPFTIEITTLDSTGAHGPVAVRVIVAQATLKGSIYYNSYSSPLASMGLPAPAGAVLRIPPGGDAEVFIGGGITACTGCHSVSANGARLMTGGIASGSYAITNGQSTAMFVSQGVGAEFSGLSPDGSVYATSAHPNGVGPRSAGASTSVAELHETDTGAAIMNHGIPAGAMMPMFSPDGRLLTFSDYALSNGYGIGLMDYDPVQRRASNYRALYTDATRYAGWPFVLPDNRAVVFALGASSDFSGFGAGLLPGVVGMPSELYIADAQTGTATILAQAMGYATPADYTNNTTYLPFGAPELHQNYYPTVSPVAAGGYFWVFFDTVRHYGNRGLGRQLWGTALSIAPDGSYQGDPSHPAFYLPGQEYGTGNHRAFTALDPCRGDGTACDTGIDCCSGFCTDGICGTPEQPRCAQLNEACTQSSDCCDPAHQCFSGFCGELLPPD